MKSATQSLHVVKQTPENTETGKKPVISIVRLKADKLGKSVVSDGRLLKVTAGDVYGHACETESLTTRLAANRKHHPTLKT